MSVQSTIEQFIADFNNINLHQMEKIIALNINSYITNSNGGVDKVVGRKSFIDRIRAMNISQVQFNVTIKQLVTINSSQGLVMVEVKAHQKEKTLHNFAAFLLTVEKNTITQLWMVEALPADSDAFWKN